MTEQTPPIDLTPYADAIYSAVADGTPCVIATNEDGAPDIAFKGSMMVWDKDHLAYWEYGLGEAIAGLRRNPRVAVLYRNVNKVQGTIRFYGEVRILEDGNLRDQVYERVNAIEKPRDPEKKGLAVLIRIDRIRRGPMLVGLRA